jgi:hypothetical protein
MTTNTGGNIQESENVVVAAGDDNGRRIMDCPCHNFTALSKIVDALTEDDRTNAMIEWLNGRTDKIAMEQQTLLSCGKRFQCRFRYGTSFAILNAIRDACKPFLDTTAAAAAAATTPTTSFTAVGVSVENQDSNPSAAPDLKIGDEASFPPLTQPRRQPKQTLDDHPGLSNFPPMNASKLLRPKNHDVGAINTLPTRKKKSAKRGEVLPRTATTTTASSNGGGGVPGNGNSTSAWGPTSSSSGSAPHGTAKNAWTSRSSSVEHDRMAARNMQAPVTIPSSVVTTSDVVPPGLARDNDASAHPGPTTGTATVCAAPMVQTSSGDGITTGISTDASSSPATAGAPSTTLTRMTTAGLAALAGSDQRPNEVNPPPPATTDGFSEQQMARLVGVYVALIRNMLVPSTPLELHFLFQLILLDGSTQNGAPHPSSRSTNGGIDGATTEKTNHTDSLSSTPSPIQPPAPVILFFKPILRGRQACIRFAQKVLGKLEDPLLRRFGPSILRVLVRSAALGRTCPGIVQSLHDRLDRIIEKSSSLEDYGETTTTTGTHAILTQPFERDRDSRHNYKTTAEVSIYQNREECRDAFLSQLRTFMTAKSRVFRNEEVDRAREVAEHESRRIIRNVSSVNMVWFAQFFCELLLQVGRSPVEEMDPDLLKIAEDRDRLQQLHKRFSNKIPHRGNKNGPQKLVLSGQRKPSSSSSGDNSSSPPPYKEALSSFPGYQEFFFIFMHSADSYNFGVHLLNQLATTTKTLMSDRSTTGLEKRALDLQMTARFLGALVFSPNWSSEAVDWKKIQPAPVVDTGLRTLDSIGLPLAKMVLEAWEGGFLLLVVPWTTELLKMSKWDTISQSSRVFRQLLANLRMIQHAATSMDDPRFCSPGMLLVAFCLESLFNDTISLPKLTSLPPATLTKSPESLDDLDRLDIMLNPVALFASSPHVEDLVYLFDGETQDSQNTQAPIKPKKLRPSTIGSLSADTRSFLPPESPRGKPSGLSSLVERDCSQYGKKWAIQQKLVDAFFHQHRDLKVICDFAVDQTLKTISGQAWTKFAIQAALEREITMEAPERDIEEFPLSAMDLSSEYLRDQLRGRVEQSLKLFAPSGVNQKVLDMATNLSVAGALQSSQPSMRSMVSVLEGLATDNRDRVKAKLEAPENSLVADAIRSIEEIQKNLSSTDPNHNVRLIAEASSCLDLLSRSSMVPSDEHVLRNLFEAIFELDRSSEAILAASLRSDNEYPWRVFVQFLYFASNLAKISSHGMKHLSGILGEEFYSLSSCELASLSKESQATLSKVAVTLGLQKSNQQFVAGMHSLE